jgi:acetylornithine deacetylase/succinyl-diaminopimelate desuccinylase-like protein
MQFRRSHPQSPLAIMDRKAKPQSNFVAAAPTLAIILAGLCLPLHAQQPASRSYDVPLMRAVDAYRRAHEHAIVDELDTLTRLRSIAADSAGLAAAAEQLQGLLRARGFKTALLRDAPGTPALVFGSLTRAGARRTVVFYAHYDGQPVTPSQWNSDPFVPVMRSMSPDTGAQDIDWKKAQGPLDPQWRLFGRAVADDKASIVAFLSALDALSAAGRKPAVNIKVVWDGEEEAGSPHIETILRANRERLAGDLWLIGDGPVHQSREPTLYFGARGIVGLEMTVYGPVRAVHDGHYGNWVPNPAAMAARLISEMRDDEGRILIPGFNDDVRPISAQALAAIGQLPPVEDSLKRELGIARSEGADGLTASTLRPALNVHGLRSGQVGSEAANAIPVDAVVSIDFRLVPDQTPAGVEEKVQAFLRAQGWTVLASTPDISERRSHPRLVKLVWETGYPALATDLSLPVSRAVIAAMHRGTDQPVALLPIIGGSVPIYLFADLFTVPVIGLPIVNHDDNQHAANENLRLQNLWDGIDAYAAMMSDLQW